MKFYDLKGYKVMPYLCRYAYNGSLAVFLQTDKGEDFATITVNIDASDYIGSDDCAYVDTNNCPWAEKFLQENKLAVPTEEYGVSGFCVYPLYRFDLSKLEEYRGA